MKVYKGLTSLENLLKNKDLKNFLKHPRHKLLDIIYRRVNAERITQGYKPLRINVYAIKTSHLDLESLDYLVKKCQNSFSFGKCFFGMLKLKDVDKELDSKLKK